MTQEGSTQGISSMKALAYLGRLVPHGTHELDYIGPKELSDEARED